MFKHHRKQSWLRYQTRTPYLSSKLHKCVNCKVKDSDSGFYKISVSILYVGMDAFHQEPQ